MYSSNTTASHTVSPGSAHCASGAVPDGPALRASVLGTAPKIASEFNNPENIRRIITALWRTAELVQSKHLRFSREPHLNHRGRARNKVCVALWFDPWLKHDFKFPKTPAAKLQLRTARHADALGVNKAQNRFAQIENWTFFNGNNENDEMSPYT